MQVIVENPNTIVIDVDQGRQGRGIESISYTEVSGQYYLIVTYTDGTTEQLGPLVVTGGAAFLLGGTAGALPYQSAPNTTTFLPIGTQNQVVVAGATAPQYTSALTGLTVNNSAIGNTTPSTGAFTNLSASGTFALTGDQVQISEGGTGQTTANGAFNALAPSQTGNAGKYLKTDGTNTAWDQLDISTADITGTLPIANGGTGQTTANSALNALLPTQAAQSGKYLKTDGTNASWDQLDISTADITGVLPIANGGTGASTAPGARANLSAAILGTNNDITSLTGITGGISSPDFVQFDTTATEANAVGKVYWDANQGTLDVGLLGGNVVSRIGQSLVAYVTNAEAVTITKGQAVYLFSAQGDRATVKLAYNTSDATSAKTFGIVAENIAAGQTGFVMCQGVLEGLNLAAFTAGATLYLGATPGTLTATKPAAPNHLVYMGVVERANAGNGQLYVKVQNGYELDEIHDVQIINPVSGQTIIYDATTSLWKNASLTAGSGISVTNGAASITIGNTGVLSFSGGTTGLTPATSTTGVVTLGGTLNVANGGTGATNAADARTNLNAASQSTTISAGTGLTGGGDLSANRTLSIANTTVTAGAYGSASDTLTATVNAQGQLTALAATPIAIANTQISGLGTMSTQNANSVSITGGSITGITDLAVADGGTGASDASAARFNLGAAASATTISAGTGLSGGGDLSANRTLSIANTTVTAGAYGSASDTLTATVNAQGQLTALAATPIAIANTQVSGLGTMSTQNSNAVTITGGSITGITDLAIADGGTGASNASGARTNLGLGTAAVLDAGVALGVATLDAGGTVPLSQLPASIQGGVSYQGSWDASTNTPTIVSNVGSKGYYYVVSVAGSTNINGISDWLPGDWIIFNGSVWQKIDNTDAVASVNGYTGVVVLSAADVGAPPTSRTITAGTGLTGGGDLSTNRTISIANTTVAAGSYGSASSVGTFTVNGQGQLTAAASTPIAITNTQVSGLGTMSTQNANSVAITGGSITGITDLAVADGGTGASDAPTARTNLGAAASATTISAGTGLTGGGDLSANRTLSIDNTTVTAASYGSASSVGTFTVNAQGQLTAAASTPIAITNTQVSGLGTMSTQNANSVAITGGTIDGATIGGTTRAAGSFTTLTLTNALGIANGGTGQTTANAAFNALAPSQTGNAGKYLTTDGTNTSWATNPLGTVTSVDVSGGTTGLTTSGGPITSSGTITLGGTLATTNGGTGLTSFTANGVVYASSTSALTTGSVFLFNGTNLSLGTTGSTNKLLIDTAVSNAGNIQLPRGGFIGFSNAADNGNSEYLFANGGNLELGINGSTRVTIASNLLTVVPGANIEGLTVGRGAGAASSNTVVGNGALASGSQSGGYNAAFGPSSLAANTSGNFNSAFNYALISNTTGSENSAFGTSALNGNTTGSFNVAVGRSALGNNTTASSNTAVGTSSLVTNTTGASNTAMGYYSMLFNTTGANNVALGENALRSNTTASNNTAVGYQAGYSNTTGDSNTAIGNNALASNTTGRLITAVGMRALYSNTTGRGSVAVGAYALQSNTTGDDNTAIGSYYTSLPPLNSNTTGAFNTAVGGGALSNNTAASNNTAVGYQAGYSNTTGSEIVAVGRNALFSNTTGVVNTAVGSVAMYSNTTGNRNVAVGNQAMYANTTGYANSAIGNYALASNTTGAFNSSFGGGDNATVNPALGANTTGSYNSAFGVGALGLNTTASGNTAVGYQAGYSNVTGTELTAVGYQALYTNTGNYNTAFGYKALTSNTTAVENTAIGDSSMQFTTTGGYNTAVGAISLYANTTGEQNVAVGREAARRNTTGNYNTVMGFQAFSTNTTGSNSTALGYYALGAATTGTVNTAIGYLSGSAITTGSKNTILGGYTGNQSGLDIRTVSNNIVISDGDGEPRILYYNAAPMTKISGVLTHNFTDTQSKSQINLYDNTNGNTEIASGYSTADFVVATGGTTGNLSYSARFNGYFVTNTGVVALINTTFTVGSNTYTVTASSSEGYIYCTPDPIGEAATGTLVGVKYATEGFRVLDNRTARFRSTVGVGDTVGATSGAGITFPATQNASSNANTLDDYEEGTFTPTLSGGFSTGPTSYTEQSGSYTKIGRFVYFQIDIDPNGVVSNASHILISGLPFTSANSFTDGFGGANVNYQVGFNTNATDSYHISLNTTVIGVYTDAGVGRVGNAAGINLNERIILFGSYQTST